MLGDKGYSPDIVYSTFNSMIYVATPHSATANACIGRLDTSGNLSKKVTLSTYASTAITYQMVVIPSNGNIIHIALGETPYTVTFLQTDADFVMKS
jgi:hypothetical protein